MCLFIILFPLAWVYFPHKAGSIFLSVKIVSAASKQSNYKVNNINSYYEQMLNSTATNSRKSINWNPSPECCNPKLGGAYCTRIIKVFW